MKTEKWKVESGVFGDPAIVTESGKFIATTYFEKMIGYPKRMRVKNANILAAALDMLEALQAVEAYFGTYRGLGDLKTAETDLYNTITGAIKKAEKEK